MLISELYLCSQGEGLLTGTPSILLRTSTCNLRCRWIDKETGKFSLCDTPFTSWNPELDNEKSPEELYKEILIIARPKDDKDRPDRKEPINHVIISGGEPTLWGKELGSLCSVLIATGFHVTIETNGTTYVEIMTKFPTKDGGEVDLADRLLFSISPKLKSSTPFGTKHEKKHKKLRINEVVLEALLKRYQSYLKFVIADPEDLKEVQKLQRRLHMPGQRIYLMPEGVDPIKLLKRGKEVNELCIKYNYRYSSREHILLYGNVRRT